MFWTIVFAIIVSRLLLGMVSLSFAMFDDKRKAKQELDNAFEMPQDEGYLDDEEDDLK